MSEVKLSIRGTLTTAARMLGDALGRNLTLVLGAAFAFLVCETLVVLWPSWSAALASSLGSLLAGSIVAVIFLNQTLRGSADARSRMEFYSKVTLRESHWRLPGYCADSILIGLPLLVLFALGDVALRIVKIHQNEIPELQSWLLLILSASCLVAALAYLPVLFRLTLKLAGRAVGDRLSGRDAWRLGTGNTLRLACVFLVWLALAAALGFAARLLNSYYVNGLLTAIVTAAGAVLLAVCYAELTGRRLPSATPVTQPG